MICCRFWVTCSTLGRSKGRFLSMTARFEETSGYIFDNVCFEIFIGYIFDNVLVCFEVLIGYILDNVSFEVFIGHILKNVWFELSLGHILDNVWILVSLSGLRQIFLQRRVFSHGGVRQCSHNLGSGCSCCILFRCPRRPCEVCARKNWY